MVRALPLLIGAFLFAQSFLFSQNHLHYQHVFSGKTSENPICYIYMPKNSSTYLRRCFFGKNGYKMYRYRKLMDKNKPLINVICVRDPLNRAISSYNEVMKLRPNGPWKKTKRSQFWKHRKNVRRSFDVFLDEIKNNFYDTHINHQHLALSKIGLTLADVDFVILQNSMDEDLKILSKKYPVNMNVSQQNRSPSKTKQILKRYIQENPSVKAKIHELWAEDFKFYEDAKKRRSEILKDF